MMPVQIWSVVTSLGGVWGPLSDPVGPCHRRGYIKGRLAGERKKEKRKEA